MWRRTDGAGMRFVVPRLAGTPAGRAAGWLVILALWAAMAAAAAANLPSDGALDFDIPAQPLSEALNRYGETARISALYPSDLPAGLRSSPVHGRYSPEEALRRLLRGTGLALTKAVTPYGDVFRLTRPASATAPGIGPAGANPAAAGYLLRLQTAVMQALCGDGRTQPGGYGAMLEVAMDETGRVALATVISPSGDTRRDAALLASLRQVRTSAPPPASAHVPYLFSLQPTPPGAEPPCRSTAGGAR